MKKFTLITSVVCLAAVSFASDLRTEIQTMNKKVCAAMMKGDIEAFKKVVNGRMTDDFVYVENGKTQTFDEMVANMKQGFAQMGKVTSARTNLLSLKQKGDTATAVQVHKMTSMTMGPDKKRHTMSFQGKSTDTFRKEGGVWKMSKMSWAAQKMTMDGKAMDMSKMGG